MPLAERFSLAATLVCGNAKIAILELTDKSSNAAMMHAKVSRTTTAPIDVCVSVTAKSLVRYVKHLRSSVDTLNATKNAKSPVHRALKIAHGRARTVRCPAPSPAVFFHVPKEVEKHSAAAISVHWYAVKSVLPLNIVRSALPKISKVS